VAVRDALKEKVQPYLGPGETINSIFVAQTTNPWLLVISYWIMFMKDSFRVVAVTDRRILVCSTGRMSAKEVKGVLRELPRSTTIGPAKGLWCKTDALGERMWVAKKFHKDVNQADAARQGVA
jgi:hypothetical protein